MTLRTTSLALLACASLSCSKPEPPKITPIAAKVTNVSFLGVDIDAKLQAYNPNDVDLTVKSVSATIILDGKYEVGNFTESKAVHLPAKKKVTVNVPLKVRWADAMGLASLVASNRDVDYLIDGTVEVGGDVLRVSLPFKIRGTVTHAQLVKAATSAIPKGLPKFPLPGMD